MQGKRRELRTPPQSGENWNALPARSLVRPPPRLLGSCVGSESRPELNSHRVAMPQCGDRHAWIKRGSERPDSERLCEFEWMRESEYHRRGGCGCGRTARFKENAALF